MVVYLPCGNQPPLQPHPISNDPTIDVIVLRGKLIKNCIVTVAVASGS